MEIKYIYLKYINLKFRLFVPNSQELEYYTKYNNIKYPRVGYIASSVSKKYLSKYTILDCINLQKYYFSWSK